MNAEEYYSREDVQQAILNISKNREVVGVFSSGKFSNRPNTIFYPADISSIVKSGCTEFHGSIERWSNPMSLREGNYETLRIGWDFIIDIDCDDFEHGKIAAKTILKAMEKHGIKNTSIKFSGGTGFHIGIPWESLPKEIDYKKTLGLFPELPRNVVPYLKEFIRADLGKEFANKYSPEELANSVNRPLSEIATEDGIDPFEIIEVDTVLISPRHLFRLPYSINSKTGLVSLPINPNDLDEFQREKADPKSVDTRVEFLKSYEEGEASFLFSEALDFVNRNKKKSTKPKRKVDIKEPVNPELFPPCVKSIAEGLFDGRKRSLFILINFLSSLKWSRESIEEYIGTWNQKNKPPLPESYVRGQLRWHGSRDKTILPPNCPSNKSGWYDSFNVCKPDSVCGTPVIKIKNPVNYPMKLIGPDNNGPNLKHKTKQ